MSRPLPSVLAIVSAALTLAGLASAQSVSRPASMPLRQASVHDGRVQGLVRDDLGSAVAGASIMALGTSMGFAKSDEHGRFSLALVPGDYVLRATRDGYVSTYRELIRIQTSALIERTITVARQGAPGAALAKDDDYAQSEAAWRLRHVTQTALRDRSFGSGFDGDLALRGLQPAPIFANLALNGQLNLLTMGSVSATSGWLPSQLPRAVASLALGAPVGTSGDWRLRGAMATTDLSSWVLLGEYQARERRAHAFTVGVSYGAQVDPASLAPFTSLPDSARSVGGLYAFDRWQVRPGLQLDYGLRLDRYDYVAAPELLSPHMGARLVVLPGTHVSVSTAQRVTAPGAEEFLPPPTSGPWLPPERTFAPLVPGTTLQAERIRHYEVGLDHDFGSGARPPSVGIARFRQSAADQVATVFGLDDSYDAAHYYVATPGSVTLEGWTVRMSGALTRRIRGALDYSVASAQWLPGADVLTVAALAPSVVRPDHERLHDVTTSLETVVPETSTRVLMCYRANTAFGRPGSSRILPFADGRFNVEVHQALPYRPLRGSKLELMLSVRNLFRELHDTGSFYDELLTVRPPLRIMGGVQVKF